ncbi:MAG: glycosyl hydrolase 2 galactose-binding domain-containing protein [Myxococcota bacterium]
MNPHGRVRSATAVRRSALDAGWELIGVTADSVSEPTALPKEGWGSAEAPGTVASSLRARSEWSLDGPARRFDAEDWWWRLRFDAEPSAPGEEVTLRFDGLATLCDVWLNGTRIGASTNMFTALRLPATLQQKNELLLRFRSLERALGGRRPRPRWRVPMIEQQQLRWFRTTLLGRTPGWSPPCPAVGPYREVAVERRTSASIDDVSLRARCVGDAGVLTLSAALLGTNIERCELVLERNGQEQRARCTLDGAHLQAELEVPRVARWWPHTHGEPALYRAHVELTHASGVERVELGSVGFRDLEIERNSGDFQLRVNGVTVFCRGACWTPLDPVTFASSRDALRAVLTRVVAGGMNMLRVGGTMVYESDDFHDLCDELGILVWQEFMFANMEYPDDEAFVHGVVMEVRQLLATLQARPSLALLCGSSEGEQQAAMWGAPRELWNQRLFHEVLPGIAQELCPDTLYWPSSAHGGEFPHVSWAGTTSYYGVGAYLRPLEDARRSEIRFASECLAFANVPAADALPGGPSVRVHHPAWKARSPRDLGAGWDFDDVRDHYVERLFGVDTRELRYSDHDRYLELGRVATGEVMAAAFSEWRRSRSQCRGALVWFLKDFWTSAGWGVLDARGLPKAAYWYLRRVLQPVFLGISDEGLNGASLHVVNEVPSPLEGSLEVRLFRQRETLVSELSKPVLVAPHQAREFPLAAWLEGFFDVTFAYRFGPPGCDLLTATLKCEGRAPLHAFYFPLGLPSQREPDLGLSASARLREDGDVDLVLRTRRFAQSLSLDVPGVTADDDFFHLAPGAEKTLRLHRDNPSSALRGSISALNGLVPLPIKLET